MIGLARYNKMPGNSFRIDVRPRLPQRIARLAELAGDLWYSWHRPARALFSRLDPELWAEVGHSPRALLRSIEQAELDAAAADAAFGEAYDRVMAEYDAYRAPAQAEPPLAAGECVAYFCAEFGLHESLPTYSGGLGILAGDHCKSASDARLPFVAVGLLYRQGYFQQTIDAEGRQQARFSDIEIEDLPVDPVRGADGAELRVALEFPGQRVACRAWRARVGRVTKYLLDTDVPENGAAARQITHQLYRGDLHTRLEQELVLGIGGARLLAALGIEPTCWHVNEGHPAFLMLERLRRKVADGLAFDAALEAVAAGTVFTTHTPVPAGHDRFPAAQVRGYLEAALPELRPHLDEMLALGRADGAADFNMTALAMRASRYQNGVSRIHGAVTRRICAPFWPQIEPEESPVRYVTNGVHLPTFIADAWYEVLDRCVGAGWSGWPFDEGCWRNVRSVGDAEFWAVHQSLKAQMLHLVRHRVTRQQQRLHASGSHIDRILRLADPERPDVLTIGFARRFATYKRATLLFERLDWLRQIAADAKRPVLFVFAGKAHPADLPGQELIRRIGEVASMPEFESRILFVENYDMRVAQRLVSGVDVWLNNPVYPLEACGTSGMKAAINGVLNLSVLDGWWGEGYDGHNGWAIKPLPEGADPQRRDAEESRTLHELLQDQVIPLYYARNGEGHSPGWVAMMKEAMASVAPGFSSLRMLTEYLESCYRPAVARARRLAADGHAAARALAAWKARVRAAWGGVALRRAGDGRAALEYGDKLGVAAAVRLNGLAPEDVAVEAVLARGEEVLERRRLQHRPQGAAAGEAHYALEFAPRYCGTMEARLRAYPVHELLAHPLEMGMMAWA